MIRQKAHPDEKKLLFSGVLILTAANLLVKICGFLYKVPLNALLGDEMANVNAAYAVYALLYTVSTAGIPSAVSLSVAAARAAGDGGRLTAVFGETRRALYLIGVGTALGMLLFSPLIARGNSGGDSYLCMLAITPAVFFSAMASVYRGYFQGFQQMTPTAVSELIEAGGKTFLGVGAVLAGKYLFHLPARVTAALSVAGITLGIALGACYLAVAYRRRAPEKYAVPVLASRPLPTRGSILRGVFAVALPIAAASAMMNLSALVDSQWMRPLLSSFYGDEVKAKAVYSDYSTGALTLVNMPGILIYPIAAAIVPYLSAARARGDTETVKTTVLSALRAGALVSLPCAFGMSALSSPLLSLVFPGDADMAANAGGLLSIAAFGIFFISFLTVGNAVLQAVGKERVPLFSVAVSLPVKLLGMFFITRFAGPVGAPVSTLAFYAAVSACDLFFLGKYAGVSVPVGKTFFRPALASVLTAAAAVGVRMLAFSALGDRLSTLAAVAVAVPVYLGAVFALGCIGREELALLPFGKKLAGKRLFSAHGKKPLS